jgi:hypothetical protein
MGQHQTPDSMRKITEAVLRMDSRTKKTVLEMLAVAFEGAPFLEGVIEEAQAEIQPYHELETYRRARVQIDRSQANLTREQLEGTQRSMIAEVMHNLIFQQEEFLRGSLSHSRGGMTARHLLTNFLRVNPDMQGAGHSPVYQGIFHELYAVTILIQNIIEDDLAMSPDTAKCIQQLLQIVLNTSHGRSYEIQPDFRIELAGKDQDQYGYIYPGQYHTASPVIPVRRLFVPQTRPPAHPEDNPLQPKTIYDLLKSVGNVEECARVKDVLRGTEAINVLIDTVLGDEADKRIRTFEELVSLLCRAAYKKVLDNIIEQQSSFDYDELIKSAQTTWPKALEAIKDELELCRRLQVKEGQPEAAIAATPKAELKPTDDIQGDLNLLRLTREPGLKGMIWRVPVHLCWTRFNNLAELAHEFEASPTSEAQTVHDLYRLAELLQAEGLHIAESGEKALAADFIALSNALFVHVVRAAHNYKLRQEIPALQDEDPVAVWDRAWTHILDRVLRAVHRPDNPTQILGAAQAQEQLQRNAAREIEHLSIDEIGKLIARRSQRAVSVNVEEDSEGDRKKQQGAHLHVVKS